MTEILHHQSLMPSVEGHMRTHYSQDTLPYRYPLTQLHNQTPSTREGGGPASGPLANAKASFHGLDPKSQSSCQNNPLKTVPNGATANPMLAPSYGGLYRSNGQPSGVSHHISRPQTPQHPVSPKQADVRSDAGNPSNSSSNESDQIASYLRIPSTINNSNGSLPEFAAQITCFFWFENSSLLRYVGESISTVMPMGPLVQEAKPTLGFQKWVTTIMSTTQVSVNVVILAMLFIYRLKKLNATVKGKPGSEYRLLTVALMLGNKFLDDNTYTNKTWAEVSGISVSEIHIMEVEFLSNMRYDLYASHDEWWAWHKKLSRFYNYLGQASTMSKEQASLSLLESTHHNSSPYSSPTIRYSSSPVRLATPTNGIARVPLPPNPSNVPSYLALTVPSPMPRMPEVDLRSQTRKRSHDGGLEEPSSKRASRNPSIPSTAENTPVPRLPMPTPSRMAQTNGPFLPHSAHLPPPTGRAMSSVYGQNLLSGDLLKPQSNVLPNLGIKIPPMDYPQSRPIPSAPGSKSSSPIGMAMTPTSELLSPMNYSINRSSPYKPVRAVNTLLVPPPSASLQNPTQNVGINDMHYQPLGKPSERRPGVVPWMPQAYPPQSWLPPNPLRCGQ